MEYDVLEYLKERFVGHGGVLVEICLYNPVEEQDFLEWRWEKRVDKLLSETESLYSSVEELGKSVERAAGNSEGRQE